MVSVIFQDSLQSKSKCYWLSWNACLWTKFQNGTSLLSWPIWALFPVRGLVSHRISIQGLVSTKGGAKNLISALHLFAWQTMCSYYACFLWILPPPIPQPLLLFNCSRSQDSWNLTSWGAIFNFFTHHSWGLGPHTVVSMAAVSSSLKMQTEHQWLCLKRRGHERQEVQLLSLNLLVYPALLTAACSVAIWQFIKCDIHVWGTLLWACFIPR